MYLDKGDYPKIFWFCLVLINSVRLNFLCVGSCFRTLVVIVAKTVCQTGFWLNLNYNPCKIKCLNSSSSSCVRLLQLHVLCLLPRILPVLIMVLLVRPKTKSPPHPYPSLPPVLFQHKEWCFTNGESDFNLCCAPVWPTWMSVLSINPFTAPACNISGLNDARTRLQTVYFPVL